MNCSGNSQSAIHVSVSGDDAVHAVFAGFEVDGAFSDCALFGHGQFEIANNFVALANDQDVLHIVVVGQKDFDVTSSSGVFGGVPANCGDSLDDETGIGGHGVGGTAR